MTPQEIFSKAYASLTKQGGPSRNTPIGSCKYRAEDGFGCAIGILVDDETAKRMDYDPNLNGTSIDRVVARHPDLPQWMYDNVDLLMALQAAHDGAPTYSGPKWVEAWQRFAAGVADRFGLQVPQQLGTNQKRWLAELRAGTYEQGTNYLNKNNQFCCLGVACEVFKADNTPITVHRTLHEYDGKTGEAPDYVMEKLGLFGRMGLSLSGDYETKLTVLNDRGKTFAEIADLIEILPQVYFKEPR